MYSSNEHDRNFSPTTLKFLEMKTGLNGEQWNNIMKLINKPEQDSLDWTKYYGYCEDIRDDRGYTIGIFGATTGGANDTHPDAPALFKEYDAVCGASHPSIQGGLVRIGIDGKMNGNILKVNDSQSTFCAKIQRLQEDDAWREAMWRTFYNVYIQYSLEQVRQRGFTWALTIGSFVDAALNQGVTGGSTTLAGILSKVGGIDDEKSFLKQFYAERLLVVDTYHFNEPPNGTNRVKQWSSLLDMGETNLKDAYGAILEVTNWELK